MIFQPSPFALSKIFRNFALEKTESSMKRLLYIIIAALAALLMLWICGGITSHERQQPQDFDINGVWVNTHTTYFDSTGRVQIDRDETKEERHAYKLYADGIVYEYTMLPGGNGEPYFVPTSMEQYLLKPEFDTLYVEGNVLVPIVEMHDSVLIVRGSDYIQHWRRVTNISQSQQKDMIRHSKLVLTRSPDLWKQELLHNGYISARRELHTQHFILMACLLLLLIGCCAVLWIYRRNRRLTAALVDLQEEIQERPEAMRETTRQLSDELYASDWYLDLKHRLSSSDGNTLSPDDWAEIERQVRRLHPTFRGRLYSLYAFSETEYRVCLLLKLQFSPTEIATAICKDKSSVSAIRSRLYAKVFGTKGSTKAWDEFIAQI